MNVNTKVHVLIMIIMIVSYIVNILPQPIICVTLPLCSALIDTIPLRYWIAPVGTYFLLAVSKVLKDS